MDSVSCFAARSYPSRFVDMFHKNREGFLCKRMCKIVAMCMIVVFSSSLRTAIMIPSGVYIPGKVRKT